MYMYIWHRTDCISTLIVFTGLYTVWWRIHTTNNLIGCLLTDAIMILLCNNLTGEEAVVRRVWCIRGSWSHGHFHLQIVSAYFCLLTDIYTSRLPDLIPINAPTCTRKMWQRLGRRARSLQYDPTYISSLNWVTKHRHFPYNKDGENTSKFIIFTAVCLFICSIFSKKPEAPTKYFSRVHGDDMLSPEFKAQAARVLSSFDMCISLLTDAGPLKAQLHHLEVQHNEMQIPAEYFDVSDRVFVCAKLIQLLVVLMIFLDKKKRHNVCVWRDWPLIINSSSAMCSSTIWHLLYSHLHV